MIFLALIISGKEVSEAVRAEIKEQAQELAKNGRAPSLAVIIVGDNPASRIYVNNKKKACEQCSIKSTEIALPADCSRERLLEEVDMLNTDDTVDGILCQLPLPAHIDSFEVIERISPEKDVDGFSPVNVGRMFIGENAFVPCTPAGVMRMLEYYGIGVSGKNCVVLGRSNIVGKPMAVLLTSHNATVTVCHSKTVNLPDITRSADILIAAIGKPCFVTSDMIKDSAVVIDVGINRNADGRLCGDVDFESVAKKCFAISPVPGGVGPMTITMLMENTLTAYKNRCL